MKKTVAFIVFAFLVIAGAHGQLSNSAEAIQLSHKIAKKMKDRLDLTAQQRQQVYQVNMNLHEQKHAVRQQNPPVDSLQSRIQRIERTRNSLYRSILGEEKYQLYLQKKKNLINNN